MESVCLHKIAKVLKGHELESASTKVTFEVRGDFIRVNLRDKTRRNDYSLVIGGGMLLAHFDGTRMVYRSNIGQTQLNYIAQLSELKDTVRGMLDLAIEKNVERKKHNTQIASEPEWSDRRREWPISLQKEKIDSELKLYRLFIEDIPNLVRREVV